MKKLYVLFLFLGLLSQVPGFGQTEPEPDLLSLLGEEPELNRITNAFKSSRVINAHSMEMLPVGVLDFRILHRFGDISRGAYELFGLDQAAMRMGFDYGFTPNLSLGFGRSTAKKELDGFVKYRILWQSTGKRNIPVSLVWVSGMTINGLKDPTGVEGVPVKFSRRLSYYHKLIIGRKFNDRFTLQVAPLVVHNNIVLNRLVPSDLFGLAIGGRAKITQRLAVVWDYSYLFNRFPANGSTNPLSIGVDIETGGHVFQLHFSNAAGMNERAYIDDPNGDWFQGQIRFGFNLSRMFQIVKPKILTD